MPRLQRNQGAAVIEVSIPLSLSNRISEEDDDACFICANTFCTQDLCARSITHLRCCSQVMCCGCALKIARRCRCTDECDAVVAFCPFCREIVPQGALEMFLGSRPACKECAKAGETTPITPTPATDEADTSPAPPEEETQ